MKQIYYIEVQGRYILEVIPTEVLSKRRVSFTCKDTCINFKVGSTIIHKGRFMRVDAITYEPIPGAFR